MTGRTRRSDLLGLLLVAVGNGFSLPVVADEPLSLDEIEAIVLTGRYEEALDQFAERAVDVDRVRAVRLEVETLLHVGRYDEAAAKLDQANAEALGLLVLRGRVALRLGDRAAASEWFEKARAARGAEAVVASFELARMAFERGDIEEATEGFYALIDAYNDGFADTAPELVAVAEACRMLGRDDPELFKDALRAFDEAVALDPSWPVPRIRLGDLFLAKYDSAQARSSLAAVLESNPRHPEALLAMARTMAFDNDPRALALVDQVLEVNPRLVPARVFRAELRLQAERYDEAREEAERALQTDSGSAEARAVLAAVEFLRGDEAEFGRLRAEVLAQNPRPVDFFNDLAEASVYNRLYPQARDFAAEAVRLDPKSWHGHGLLGLNRLRLGDIPGGRESLETAFAGDPYNVWIKNTLDLLDTFGDYREVQSEHFEFHIHQTEVDLLAPYMVELAEQAYAVLAERYRFEPPTPIRVEVYPSHADFSVRTVGLTGLGALGVCFGPVLALDSPSARQTGHFNWGATLWHEIAHTFTLYATDAKIPRWLTEGLSVFEERRARPAWGDDVQVDFIFALRDGELLGIREMNDGFIRPKSPRQIGWSYYQASLITEWIVEQRGFDAILSMLDGYRRGLGNEQVFAESLALELAEFDSLFFDHLRERFGGALAALGDAAAENGEGAEETGEGGPSRAPTRNPFENRRPDIDSLERRALERPGDFRSQMEYGYALYREERFDDAEAPLRRGRDLFPEYVGPGNPYTLLAEIYRREERDDEAIATLETLVDSNETAWDEHIALADLLGEADRAEEEADILERTLYISPFDADVHRRLAERSTAAGRHEVAVRERAALVALDPADRASALYQLARAERDAGRIDAARKSVLRALEVAPGFDQAQELLLEVVERRSEVLP